MPKQDTGPIINQDEFSKIFDEYRARIEEITRRTEKNLLSIDNAPEDNIADKIQHIEGLVKASQPEPSNNGNNGNNGNHHAETVAVAPPEQEPAPEPESEPVTSATILRIINSPQPTPEPARAPEAHVIKPPPKAADPTPVKAPPVTIDTPFKERAENRRPGFEGYTEIIEDARREAKNIIEEAEASARKEAKKRTQNQADKIIEKAKKEAEDIADKANRAAEKMRDGVIAESKKEADYIIREITQKYRDETETQSSQLMAEAQEKAQIMLSDISESTTLVGQHITEIVNRAKKTMEELETSLRTEAMELTRIISETQSKLETVGKASRPVKVLKTDKTEKTEKAEREPSGERIEKPGISTPVAKQNDEPAVKPMLSVRLIGEKTAGGNGTGILFLGQMEMKSVSEEFDYQYLKRLKKYLVHIANIKYLQEYASEKEMSVVFDILQPLPLMDILSNIPMVDEVITRADDDIDLVFRNEG